MIKRFLDSKNVAGIECILLPDGKQAFNLIFLKKEKSKVITESSHASVDLEELKRIVSPKVPVSLSVNGKGLIHKKVSMGEKDDLAALLHKVFPNTNLQEFYVQHTAPDSSSNVFVSVIRKSIMDEILSQFSQSGYFVVSCALGPFGVASVLPLMDSPVRNELSFSGHHLSIYEGQVADYRQSDIRSLDPTLIGGEYVKPELVIPFAAALSYFSGFSLANNILTVNEQNEAFRQKAMFQTAGVGVLFFFLISLLVNFFLFSYYDRQKKEYISRVSMSMDMLQRHDTLKKQIEQRQKFLEEAGLLEASRSSYYADRLASDLPSAIRLSQLNVFPFLKSPNETDTKMTFLQKDIRVSGSCRHSTELNEWMKIIKKKDWVGEVAILNYTQDRSQEEGAFSMEIKIRN